MRQLADYVTSHRAHLNLRILRAQLRAQDARMMVYKADERIHTCICTGERSHSELAASFYAEAYVIVRLRDDDDLDAID